MKSRFTLLLMIFAAAFQPAHLSAAEEDDNRRILTVSASGTVRITATRADVRLAIEERGATDIEARERMARRSGTLMDYLREEGVERLETMALRLHPIYDYTRGDREIVGYQAMTVVRFSGQASTIGFIIDEAIARGANQVQELIFTADEGQIEEARHQALRSATALAMKRAEAVLAELELTPAEIIRIHLGGAEDDGPMFEPVRVREGRAAPQERASAESEPSEPEVRARVTLEILY